MKASHEVSHQDVQWVRQWWQRDFDVRARNGLLARLSQEQSAGKTSGGAPGQFARICLVGTSNAIIDFGVLNAALAAFPTHFPVLLLAYNTAAVVLAATNSFVWNRRFTFRVRGPLQACGLSPLMKLSRATLFLVYSTALSSLRISSEKPFSLLGGVALHERLVGLAGARIGGGPTAKLLADRPGIVEVKPLAL